MGDEETGDIGTIRRHELLGELMERYEDDEASVKTIYSHWDDEGFDKGDYEELVGILELF